MAQDTFRSIPDMFLHRTRTTPDADAFLYKKNGGWDTLTWKQVLQRVKNIATGFAVLGLSSEDRAAILCGTRVEWILADIGILCAGGATTTIYPSNTAEECAYIVSDSNSRFVVAENDEQVEKLVEERANLSSLEKVIVIDGRSGHDGWVITLADLEALGMDANDKEPDSFEARAMAVQSDHLATLIYTSGTTGRPKGVELVHDCWVFEAEAMDSMGTMANNDRQFLFLPLAHVFAKVLEVAIIRIGIPTAIDGSIENLVANMQEVQPTFTASVPRVFEKVYNKVVAGAHDAGGLKLRIFKWAMVQGRAVSAIRQEGGEPYGLLALKYAIADRLVFSKIRATFGGSIRFFISGGAPLSKEIAAFFHAAGLTILEGYGLTESSAASFVNLPEQYKFGTVGPALPGVELKFDPADGEIMLKSRGVMRGYHNRPEATAEMLDGDWLRTGDIGELDENGFLRITDRKKDLIKTSGGKYIAPQKLENRLKTMSTYLSQVLVHGNTRNFCSALITLNEEEIEKWAEDNSMAGASIEELANNEQVRGLIEPLITELNSELAR
ncbi:MAG: AMP-dependent synthetase/ligase, partial [Myxococcota bacterium]